MLVFRFPHPAWPKALRTARPSSPAGGEAYWIATLGGMTRGPPHPVWLRQTGLSTARGEAGLDSRLRGNDTGGRRIGAWIPACPGMTHGAQE